MHVSERCHPTFSLSGTLSLRGLALVLLSLFAANVATVSGAIEGFRETFDGEGDFTGVADFNVAWQGSLEWNSGTLSIVNEPGYDETSQAYFSRILSGSGSFTQKIRVHDLDLGDLDGASPISSTGYVQLLFTIGEPTDDPNRLMLFLIEPEGYEDTGLVAVESKTSGQFNGGQTVKLGSSIEFGMSFDYDARQVRYWYDADYDDPMSAFVELGPYDYTGTLDGDNLVGMNFVARWDGHASGLLDNWVFQPSNSAAGDFNFDGMLDTGDLELLQRFVKDGQFDDSFDLVADAALDQRDLSYWVGDLKQTYFGDVDLDGEFNSADLINVFQAGEYEDNLSSNSSWSTGDWNSDGDFTTSDLVIAFQDGGYEQGSRAAASFVPEPSGVLLGCMSLLGEFATRRGRRRA
ncbi:MAG: hypothetical protein KDB23_07900 [Planctomycetales bacterium]|nr:hypothetical protein [Planctomycetales bacterium]